MIIGEPLIGDEGKNNGVTQTQEKEEEKEEMKCPRCISRGNVAPDYKLKQRNSKGREEVYMECPKCGYVGGSIRDRR